MKVRRGMPQQSSEKMLVTFHDVAAGFSEEEWKLLHEWQKELYKTVMKEIHQAMISLGPVIATSVFSLGAQEKDGACPMAHEDAGNRLLTDQHARDTIPEYEIAFGINVEEHLYRNNPMDGAKPHEPLNTGYPVMNVDNVLRPAKGCEPILTGHHSEEESCPGINLGLMDTTPVVSFSIKEESSTYSKDQQHSAGRGTLDEARGEPFSIKEDTLTYVIDCLNSDRREIPTSPTGGGQKNRTKKDIDSEFNETIPPGTASHVNSNSNVLQSSNKITNCQWQWWSQQHEEVQEEKTVPCERQFGDSHDVNLQDPISDESDQYNENESNLSNTVLLACQTNTKHKWRSSTSTEYERRLRQTKDLYKHRRTYHSKFTGTIPKCDASMYQCTYCAKIFNHKGHFTTHIRTHTKERPFPCNECEKSFSTKGNLIIHRRLHTGERPYHCTGCKKSFSQQGHLTKHYKTQHMQQSI
ncbi:zinc finger protein 583-like isoform X2 [Ambystoma mexicanum]|uniref:zinc finger protein 583-like isoform X2 n=1 Tax=Ambystoma mexicanum TaxID=8296 RepID=UPI0037E712DD